MATMLIQFVEMAKGLLQRALLEKVRPMLLRREGINVVLLDQAIPSVERKVGRILDSITVFDPDLLLAKIPSLEFLELLVVSEYLFLQALEHQQRGRGGARDPDAVAAFKKIFNAYGIYTAEELERYRTNWRDAWVAAQPAADLEFDLIKAALTAPAGRNGNLL